MSWGFRVDLDALQEAADGVNGVIDAVSRQQVSDIPCDQSAIGNHQLAGSLSDFLDRWQRGVNNLAQDGRQIADRLTDSVNDYRKADDDGRDAIDGIFQGTGADPGVSR
jgi:hypothetical protein